MVDDVSNFKKQTLKISQDERESICRGHRQNVYFEDIALWSESYWS